MEKTRVKLDEYDRFIDNQIKSIEQVLTEASLYIQQNLTRHDVRITQEISHNPSAVGSWKQRKYYNNIELRITVKVPEESQ